LFVMIGIASMYSMRTRQDVAAMLSVQIVRTAKAMDGNAGIKAGMTAGMTIGVVATGVDRHLLSCSHSTNAVASIFAGPQPTVDC
jgi:beta-phosphoglucomutase-like phosphatase (HAD superfamily)